MFMWINYYVISFVTSTISSVFALACNNIEVLASYTSILYSVAYSTAGLV